MGLTPRLLGGIDRDTALAVTVQLGTGAHRLLLDCGQGCPEQLTRGELRQIEHIFFSHFHVDHVAGFDGFFRWVCDREEPPVSVWGPPGTLAIVHHRLQGFLWNLVHPGQPGRWVLHEVDESVVRRGVVLAREGFSKLHPLPDLDHDEPLVDAPAYTVRCIALDHGAVSLGYRVDEKPRFRILPEALAAHGLEPGPWLKAVAETATPGDATVEISGREITVAPPA